MDKTKRLVEAGFLPKELPLEFTSQTLAECYTKLLPNLSQFGSKSKAETFNLARSGHGRRVLRIPNPRHFIEQAAIIGANWKAISAICDASPLSESKPKFRARTIAERNRATNLRPSQGLSELRLRHSASCQYVLQADFAQFFASVYTHAISWAIHTKAVAKKNYSTTLFGNALDKAVQNAQDGQTMGIPVGPDTSHIISELVASRIDVAAFGNKKVSGYRYIDDYFIGFDTESDAIRALDQLASAAREFEIEINYEKTSIKKVSETTEAVGLDSLRDFSFGPESEVSRQDLHHLFAIATERNTRNEHALKYAIRMLGRRTIDHADWDILESYLLRSGTLSPNTLEFVAYTLFRHAMEGAPLNRPRIKQYLEQTVVRGLSSNRHSDVTWALWILKALGIKTKRGIAAALSTSDNSAIALLSLDLEQSALLSGRLDTARWRQMLTPNGLFGEHWLLVYESAQKGWLTPPSKALQGDPLYAQLNQNKVSFYEPNRVQRIYAGLRTPSRTKKLLLEAENLRPFIRIAALPGADGAVDQYY